MTRRRLKKRLGGGEAGLTIIEVLVAAVVLVLGSAAAFGVLGAATRNAQRAKATQVALDLAQEELERLRAIPYANLSLNTTPTPSEEQSSPNYRVNGATFAVKRSPRSEYEPLVIDAENGVAPESEVSIGDAAHDAITGTLYRFVVWRNDPSCSEEDCPGPDDYKQIVVAVRPDSPIKGSANRGYVEVQSEVTEPKAGEPEGGGGASNEHEAVTAQQFYLSDTPCEADGTTTEIEPSEDHLLHNTLGTCADGLKTGNSEPGAPDALLLNVPPDPAPEDPSIPVLHDYSDDFYLEPTPDTDKGVQIRRDDTSGCHYVPTGTTHPESQVHRWVTDPMTSAFVMGGRVVLDFYTRTLNDAIYKGALCIYLFHRVEKEGKVTDEFLTEKGTGNTYWLYVPQGNAYWPRNLWTEVRVTMEFEGAPEVIEPTDRLGVALSVERAGTPAEAIPIMYDHPNYPTRLEVQTSTPLEGG